MRGKRHLTVIVIVIAVVLCIIYSFFEPNWLSITHDTLSVNLPKEFEGFTVVFLSDTHVYNERTLNRLAERVALVNAQSPDIILLGGDYLNNDAYAQATFKVLSELKAKQGIFAARGNHDKLQDSTDDVLLQYMREAGITPCLNTSFALEKNNARIYVAGIDDEANADIDATFSGLTQDDFVLLLAHDPKAVKSVKKAGLDNLADLAFCGHTHGGQITFFGVFGFLTDRWFTAYLSQWRPIGQINTLYSNGAGEWLPMRFFARPQINVVTLKANG